MVHFSDGHTLPLSDMKPFALAMPERLRHPLMLASPHSGRIYPDCFLEQSRLNMATLRRSEDFCVDGLYNFAPSLNLPYMVAQFPRSFVDVNRSAEEIDPTLLFQEEAEQNIEISRRVANGLGVIPRVVGAGIEIYPDPVGLFETRQRLAQFHIPYHEALQHCLAQIHEQCGAVVLIDCHSMPDTVSTRRLSAGKSCDIVLGDRYGASCHRDVVEAAEACFKKLGYRVARNDPYAGGYITQRYGSPEKGLHSLQIEINRRLYMDERKLRLTPGFESLKANLKTFVMEMIEVAHTLPTPGFHALAAE